MESEIKEGYVYTTLYLGEKQTAFIHSIKHCKDNIMCHIIFSDGAVDWFTIDELDIDLTTLRKYDSDIDPDFYGMLM